MNTTSNQTGSFAPIDLTASLVGKWQSLIAACQYPPAGFGGPEYATTKPYTLGKFSLLEAPGVFMPLSATDPVRQFGRMLPAWNGVDINSLFGVTEVSRESLEVICEATSRCSLNIHLPQELYESKKQLLQEFGFYRHARYPYHVIPLPEDCDAWFSDSRKWRYALRRGEKAELRFEIGGTELVETVFQLYQKTFERWEKIGNEAQMHERRRFQALLEVPGSLVRIAVVFKEDQPAAAVMFCIYGKIASYLVGVFDSEFTGDRPSENLQARLIAHLVEQGATDYNLGTSIGIESLEKYKESLGGVRRHAVELLRPPYPGIARTLHWLRSHLKSNESRSESDTIS